MAKFELPHAVSLLTQQNSVTNSLWTVYVATTFAAAGFALSSTLKVITASAVTIGYLAFTIGHAMAILQSLIICRALRKEIASKIKDEDFKLSLSKLAKKPNPLCLAVVAHALIDLCVIAAIWTRVVF